LRVKARMLPRVILPKRAIELKIFPSTESAISAATGEKSNLPI
jgi:hypothetical protein